MKKLTNLLQSIWNFLKNPAQYFRLKRMEKRLEKAVVERTQTKIELLKSAFAWLRKKNTIKGMTDHHNTMLARKKFGDQFSSSGIKDLRIKGGKMYVVK